MSNVLEQIDRIRDNVTAALSALTGKGVTVPSGAKSDDLAELIASIDAVGDTSVADAIIDGTIVEYTSDNVTRIRDYAFWYYFSLTSVNFPVASYIGDNAFTLCSSLTSVNFPVASYIGDGAFEECSSLTSVNFPVASYIGNGAFMWCSSLTSVNFPVASYIGDGAFMWCSSLTSVNFPVASYIGDGAFEECSSLTSVNFPVATSIRRLAFEACSSLTSVVLGASTVCKLSHSNAFSSTLMSTTGWFYVPASLIVSYQGATNWTYFSSRFSAIEDMPTT